MYLDRSFFITFIFQNNYHHYSMDAEDNMHLGHMRQLREYVGK